MEREVSGLIYKIEFWSEDRNRGYDIKNDEEHFRLLLDGAEIEVF